MSDQSTSTFRFTAPVQMIWGYLTQPKDRTRFNAPPRYEATFLIRPDHPDVAALKALMKTVCKEKWADLTGVEWCVEDGDARAERDAKNGKKRDFFRGNIVLQTHANVKNGKGDPLYPPSLVVLNERDEYVRFNGDERKAAAPFFYSGVLTIPTVNIVSYETKGKEGVTKWCTAYINEVLSINAGEKIATGVDDEGRYGKAESFAAYRGRAMAGTDPRAGADEDDDLPI
jgi:hypothetical protein